MKQSAMQKTNFIILTEAILYWFIFCNKNRRKGDLWNRQSKIHGFFTSRAIHLMPWDYQFDPHEQNEEFWCKELYYRRLHYNQPFDRKRTCKMMGFGLNLLFKKMNPEILKEWGLESIFSLSESWIFILMVRWNTDEIKKFNRLQIYKAVMDYYPCGHHSLDRRLGE